MLRLAVRGLWMRKRRLVTTSLAIALGVAFLSGTHVLSSVLADSVDSHVGSSFARYDAVVQSPNVQQAAFGQELREPVDEAVVERVLAVEGVADAAGVVESASVHVFGHRGGLPNRRPPTVVLNWTGGPLQRGAIVEGRPPEADGEAVLDVGTAGEVGYRVGRPLTVIGPDGRETFTLVGLMRSGTAEPRSDPPTVLLTTAVAQRFAQVPGAYSYVAVSSDGSLPGPVLEDRIRDRVPDLEVVGGDAYARQRARSLAWYADLTAGFVAVFGVIAVVVAWFVVHNTFSILVTQQAREHALMRAVGALRRQVVLRTLAEAVGLGLVASLVGFAGGVALATVVTSFVGRFFSVPPGRPPVSPASALVAVAVGVAVTVVAALVPAWRSSAVPPAAIIDEPDEPPALGGGRRAWWAVAAATSGVAAIATGWLGAVDRPLLPVGVGAALVALGAAGLAPVAVAPVTRVLALPFAAAGALGARLAADHAGRNPRRTAVAALSLTIGVALVVLVAVLANSVRASTEIAVQQRVRADYVIRTSSFATGVGVTDAQREQVAGIDGVETVSPVRLGPVRIVDRDAAAGPDGATGTPDGPQGPPDGADLLALGIDPATFPEVVEVGAVHGSLARVGDGAFAATASVADARGWSLGDRVRFHFPRGGARDLELVATVEHDFAQAGLLLDRSTFEAHLLPTFNYDAVVLVRTDPGAQVRGDRFRAELESVVEGYPNLAVEDLPEYVESRTAPLETLLAVVYGLLGLAVVVALTGIANTLSLSILERRRELGIMRALGMTRGQVRRMVVGESALVAAFGTALGLLLGLALSLPLVRALGAGSVAPLDFHPPPGLLVVIAVVGVLSGVLAAIPLAWYVSRGETLDALRSV